LWALASIDAGFSALGAGSLNTGGHEGCRFVRRNYKW
jgi:hypothetical protein